MDATSWFDLDAAPDFDFCCQSLRSGDTRNFAVSFDTKKAQCAINLSPLDFHNFLQAADKESQNPKTRWINFWDGEYDADGIKTIARRYGLSSRLAAQLCAARLASKSTLRPAERVKEHRSALKGCTNRVTSASLDLERASSHSTARKVQNQAPSKPPEFGDIVNDLWHFCSVDRGPNYLCVGFNALFNLPDGAIEQKRDSNKPAGLRIWTSLLLCNDGTVISVFEHPPNMLTSEDVTTVRYNVLNVFRQLSKLHSSIPVSAMMQVGVRPFSTADTAGICDAESGALLFYYLFDDWRATYSLITQRDHPYRDTLSHIRREMLDSADPALIQSLDLVGRQLTVLKLIYQSYELIIQRILRQSDISDPTYEPTALDHRRASSVTQTSGLREPNDLDNLPIPSNQDSGMLGGAAFSLPLSVRVRFERLLDRVRLYALTEIEECLKEKDSLVFMNFNLVSLKESQAVEKLTRTTILLAKATIVFLPVSLMTGYFSVQLSEINKLYSLTTYWVCFPIVVVLSVVGLVVFDIATSRVEGKTTYKSLTRTFMERLGRGKWKRP